VAVISQTCKKCRKKIVNAPRDLKKNKSEVNLLIRNSQYSTVADPWAASLAYTQQKCAKL